MEANDFSYGIYSSWLSKPEAPLVIGQRFLRTLDALSRLDPELRSWIVNDGLSDEGAPLDQVRREITDVVESGLRSGDNGIPNVRYGYAMYACNHNYTDPKLFELSVYAGGEVENQTTLRTGGYKTPLEDTLIRYPLFKGALMTILENWPAPWAKVQVYRSEAEYIPFGPGGAVEIATKWEQRLTWLGYLSAERARGLALPHDLLTERTPDGGLLMIAAEERLDPSNAIQMKHAHLITEIMAKYGHDMNFKRN